MIRIKRITSLDVLTETVPKPKGAVPKFGLPKWKLMPLEDKIPVVPGPRSVYNFTRRKVGRKLWAKEPRKFDLSDPYCYETKFPYDPLHDQHLFEFFSRPNNITCLLKADLITNDMEVKCSLRDYNIYRKYLRRVHADRIKRELSRRNCLFVEKRVICCAENQAQKETEKLKKEEKLLITRQRAMQQQVLQIQFRKQKQQEAACKTAQRLRLLRLVRQEKRRLANIRRIVRAEQMQQKRKTIAQQKMTNIITNRKRKEKSKTRIRNKILMDTEQRRRKTMEEKWKRKQNFQETDIMKQKMLLQYMNTRRQEFIKNYNDKINNETIRMQRLFENTKLFINCYIRRHLPDGKERICCKKYLKRNKNTKKAEIENGIQNSNNHSFQWMKGGKHKLLSKTREKSAK